MRPERGTEEQCIRTRRTYGDQRLQQPRHTVHDAYGRFAAPSHAREALSACLYGPIYRYTLTTTNQTHHHAKCATWARPGSRRGRLAQQQCSVMVPVRICTHKRPNPISPAARAAPPPLLHCQPVHRSGVTPGRLHANAGSEVAGPPCSRAQQPLEQSCHHRRR